MKSTERTSPFYPTGNDDGWGDHVWRREIELYRRSALRHLTMSKWGGPVFGAGGAMFLYASVSGIGLWAVVGLVLTVFGCWFWLAEGRVRGELGNIARVLDGLQPRIKERVYAAATKGAEMGVRSAETQK